MTGFTGDLSGNNTLGVYGNFISGASNTYSGSGQINMRATSGTKTITCNGNTIARAFLFNGSGGTFQLSDNFSSSNTFSHIAGSIDANNKNITLTGSASMSLPTISNMANFSWTGTATKTNTLSLSGNWTLSGTITLNGNSAINRLLVQSSVKGTQRTITAATVSVTNADFQDIVGAGAGSWNLSAITGLSGDCGGNSGITFTTPATTTCSAGTTWSTATWSSRVPLPQDTATFSGSSRTITQDMPRIGAVNFTGSSGLTWTTSTACSFFGSINLTNLGTLTASTQAYTYEGRGNSTLTSAGKSFAKGITINCVGGKLTFGDAFLSTSTFTHTSGTLDTGNNSTQSTTYTISGTGTRTLTPGSSTWTLTLGTGTVATFSTTTTTYTSNTATFKCTGALTGSATIATGGVNFNGATLWNATTNAFDFILTGSGTFGTYKSDASRSLKFTAGTTTTAQLTPYQEQEHEL